MVNSMSDVEPREEAIFAAALQLRAGARVAYLDEACGGDPVLRERIEGLLAAFERDDGLLNGPAVPRDPAPRTSPLSLIAQPGEHIGGYRLLQQIGEGGCGVVYMADQTRPVRRRVALKILKPGMDTKQVIARFEAERQALALMDHPHIAKVLDAGATENGRPYFVMELVRGVRITEFCDENQLPMKQRLELFVQVCQAIQHAHQKGVIHRDIKPSNILVTVNDGVAVPKVIDFGIAKATTGQPLTNKTLFTAFEQFIGTPAYMSPEQAVMTSLDIDTRSDIYSLGVLLYELLTGETPFDTKELLRAGFDEMRRTICEKEPARPSTRLSTMVEGELTTTAKRRHTDAAKLIHLVRGDLDWIVMKCLEKDRARRYETANGLARDIGRHLNCEPVFARPPSRWYEFQKTVRRHRFGFAAGAAVFFVLAAGVLTSTWQAVRATRAEGEQIRLRQRAEQAGALANQQAELARKNAADARAQQQVASQQEALARGRFYAAQMNLAMQAWEAGDVARTLDLLETQRPQPGQQDPRAFEWFHLWGLSNARLRFSVRGHAASVNCVAFSPNGEFLASSGQDGAVRVWNTGTGEKKPVLELGFSSNVFALEFTPDGNTLVTRSANGVVQFWEIPSGRSLSKHQGRPGILPGLALSSDGKWLACGGEKGITVWDLASGAVPFELPIGERGAIALSFSPDGKTLASVCDWSANDAIWLWDLTSTPPVVKRKLPGGGSSIAWTPDGRTLASVWKLEIRLWDPDTGELKATLKGHSAAVVSLAFKGDGRRLVSCGRDRIIRLWHLSPDPAQKETSEVVGAHLNSGSSVAVSADGALIASGDNSGFLKLWSGGDSREQARSPAVSSFRVGSSPKWSSLDSLHLLPDHQVLVVTGEGTERRELTHGQKLEQWPEAAGRGVLSADREVLATSGFDGTVKLWDLGNHRLLASFTAHPANYWPPAMAFTRDRRILITGGFGDGTMKVWDLAAEPRLIRSLPTGAGGVNTMEASPDGKRVLAAIQFQRILILDTLTWRPENIFRIGDGFVQIHAAVFSPGGTLLATGAGGGLAGLWEFKTGLLHAALKGHTTSVRGMAFSHDGGTLATAGDDRTVRLWEVATGQERVTFKWFQDSVIDVAFTPDGNTFLAGESGGTVWILRASHTVEADQAGVAPEEEPGAAGVYNSQAWPLATSPDDQVRDGNKALKLATKAAAATARKDANILDTLAAAYAEVGQFTNAVRVEEEAMALLKNEDQKLDYGLRLKLYQASTPYRDDAELATRVSALLAEGGFDDAEPRARACLALRERQMPDDWRIYSARAALGQVLLGQKKYAEAEPWLLSGYEGMEQRNARIPAAGKERLREALRRLVNLYEGWGKPDKTAEWQQKLAKAEKAP
jgi:WD40 repeat protein/serine/threonine protein kinase